MATLRQTNQPSMTTGLDPLSPHYITLIRPQESLPLAKSYCKLFILKYIFKIYGRLMSLIESYHEKGNIPSFFFIHIYIFKEQYNLEATSGQSWHNYIGPKRENPKFV